jgi:hypothetical protein
MRIFTSLLVAAAFTSAVSAQTTVSDSIQSGPNYANEVYYSFKDGKVQEAPANEWQLSFSIGSFNVAVRTNSAATDGTVSLYEMPGTDTTQWATFDTSGLSTWATPVNSDQDWQIGALNQSGSGQADYGWGEYNSGDHVIYGHRLYLAVIKSGGTTLYKKLWVLNKALGTWNVRFANLDGTDQKEVSMASSTYSTKNFVYLSLVTGNVIDREPAKDAWDFVLTRYVGDIGGGMFYPVYGILTNAGVKTAEVRGMEETTTTLSDSGSFSNSISVIGSDWKNMMLNGVTDSLSFFVKDHDGDFWKLVFTYIESGSQTSGKNGKVVFNKTNVTPTPTGVSTIGNEVKGFAVYPNPANDMVNVLFDTEKPASIISISDLSGRTLFTQNINGTGFQKTTVHLGSLAKGIYLVSITNGTSRSVQKVVVQ